MPHTQGDSLSGHRPPAVPEATRIESDEDIREAIKARKAGRRAGKTPVAKPHREAEVPPERPQQRSPTPLLCILDDGRQDGEWLRLRRERCVIGRLEGDVQIANDGLISSRHAEIARQTTKDGARWLLIDLGSTNGTWVRVSRTPLQHGSELLIGRGRYRFEAAGVHPPPAAPPAGTQSPWGPLPAFLVELTPAGAAQRFPLTLPEYWVGRDARLCAIARPDDAIVSPRHARLYRDADGQWHVENNQSFNGVWLRIAELTLPSTCQFRMGEQRFLFKLR
jgi:pSer/pThr/pTyr-binding forkhead associated (FHA) protein